MTEDWPVPPGWKLVPADPDIGMMVAGGVSILREITSSRNAHLSMEHVNTARNVYASMVGAAKPPKRFE